MRSLLEEIDGTVAEYVDPQPGPGLHRYRIVALQGNTESFPTVVTNQPGGIPGTFLRGDANSDQRINITDVSQALRSRPTSSEIQLQLGRPS